MEIGSINTSVPSGISDNARSVSETAPHQKAAQATPCASDKEVAQAVVDVLAESLPQPAASSLQFSVDDESGQVVIRVIDGETQEVIKQFPSEEAIALLKSLTQLGSLHRVTG
ncbi:MAG: flagellar protein FlaG [Burkholderiaceae bacterium]|jgi:flagellar protein FlaG|nr:flagellar protein FlaG [Burkholderiaceae bacterium]